MQIGNTPFVHEQDHYISSLKDINLHWVKESVNVAFAGKKHFIWSLKQKTRLGDAQSKIYLSWNKISFGQESEKYPFRQVRSLVHQNKNSVWAKSKIYLSKNFNCYLKKTTNKTNTLWSDVKIFVWDMQLLLYTAFAHDVTAAMLVFQFKIVLIRFFCLEHQHGCHGLCWVDLCGMSANAL